MPVSIYKNKILFDNKFHHKFFNEFAKNITRRKKKASYTKGISKVIVPYAWKKGQNSFSQ